VHLALRYLLRRKGKIVERDDSKHSVPNSPSADASVNDAIIISDLHLGSSICQDKHIIEFLEDLESSRIQTRELILNGDVFDSIDFRRLNKRHWKVLSLLRKISDRIAITWVCGNHDGPAEPISHLLGVDVRDEYVFKSGDRSVLVLHGHQFDEFVTTYPRVTFLADIAYRFLQWIDETHRVARFAKNNTKVFLRCVEKVRNDAIAYAASRNIDIVCCGHTHLSEMIKEQLVHYFNSGCWTEFPSNYLSVKEGLVQLNTFISAKEIGSDKIAAAAVGALPSPELAFG